MKFFLPIVTIASCALSALSLVACSKADSTAGIEIGNPSIADSDTVATIDTTTKKQPALPLVADFSVDYSNIKANALAKVSSQDEPVLLDDFSLVLTQVRSFSSYYTNVSIDAVKGLQLWPYEDDPNAELAISFTEGSSVQDPFKNIDLQEEGYLKEMGVGFRADNKSAIHGKVLIGNEYKPFVYSLSYFQSFMLRYHYSQIDTANGIANLSVIFRVKHWIKGVDFASATLGTDGILHLDSNSNAELWNTLNERFVPSFQPLRYDYVSSDGKDTSEYVLDIWEGIAADVKENTIINGNFQSPFTTDWILMNQFGGKADTSVIIENGKDRIMKVHVTQGGTHSYSVQLIQENVALIKDVEYQCVFTIWSDVEDSITARIGSYNTYETEGFQQHVFVHKTGHSVAITFTAKVSDPFARFELNLGGKERTFWIKEVQVIRLSK